MKLRTLLLFVMLGVIVIFTALNWNVFILPTDLSLGLTVVQWPLGLLMLGILVFVSVAFLAYILYMQTTVLFDTRRHSREMQVNRDLADKAEASRFTELRLLLETEMAQQTSNNKEANAAVMARVDQLEHALRTVLEQSSNSFAAYIGEIEDRMERTKVLQGKD